MGLVMKACGKTIRQTAKENSGTSMAIYSKENGLTIRRMGSAFTNM